MLGVGAAAGEGRARGVEGVRLDVASDGDGNMGRAGGDDTFDTGV